MARNESHFSNLQSKVHPLLASVSQDTATSTKKAPKSLGKGRRKPWKQKFGESQGVERTVLAKTHMYAIVIRHMVDVQAASKIEDSQENNRMNDSEIDNGNDVAQMHHERGPTNVLKQQQANEGQNRILHQNTLKASESFALC